MTSEAQPSLIDYKGTPALLVASKQGDLYVLDRATGKSLAPIGSVAAPPGGVEPTERAPRQIVSLWHSLKMPRLVESDMWGMSPIDQMICRIQFRQADYRGEFTPPRADKYTIEYPGYNGGSDWGSLSIDPARGIAIANYNDTPNYLKLVPRAVANQKGIKPRFATDIASTQAHAVDPQWGVPYAIQVNAGWRMPFTKLLCKRPPYGGIRAIDIATGKTIVGPPAREARRNGPFNLPTFLPFNIGTPNNGGAVTTAGGLMFIAAATDDLIRAIDLSTGKVRVVGAASGRRTGDSDRLPAGRARISRDLRRRPPFHGNPRWATASSPTRCQGAAKLLIGWKKWWAWQGLNLRPLRCQHSALPLSYTPTRRAN